MSRHRKKTGIGIIVGAIFFLGSLAIPVQADPLVWKTSLNLSERYDDNIFIVRDDPDHDWVTFFTPRLRLETKQEGLQRYLQYRPRFEWYARHSDLATVSHFVDFEWTAPFIQTGKVTLINHFSYTPDFMEIATGSVVVPRGKVYANDAGVDVQTRALELSYRNGWRKYEDPELTDSLSHDFEERFSWHRSSPTVLMQRYHTRQFVHDNDLALETHTIGVGFQHSVSRTFSLGAEAGVAYWQTLEDDRYQNRPMIGLNLQESGKRYRFSLSLRRDVQTELSGEIEYQTSQRVLRLHYSRDLTVGGGLLGSPVDHRGSSVHLRQELSRRKALNLSGYRDTYKPENQPGRYIVYRADFSLQQTIRPGLTAVFLYRYLRQDHSDDLAGREFTRNQLMLILRTDFS